MTLTHASPKKNRLAISRWGLIPRRPTEHNYRGAFGLDDQPVGVYAMVKSEGALPWSGVQDIWEFEWDGPVLRDDLVYLAVVVPEQVPPEKLRLVKKACNSAHC